eukprot:GEMP01031292.1.p1 GENE.GEMP01031292.1~~GEMP01031292.1.p1  ORF type:complete len:294 (+),score=40.78 GEMP01031292.1:31-882(+)
MLVAIMLCVAALEPTRYNFSGKKVLQCGDKYFHGSYIAFMAKDETFACISLAFNGKWYLLSDKIPSVHDSVKYGLDAWTAIKVDMESIVLLGHIEWSMRRSGVFKMHFGEINGIALGFKTGVIETSVEWDSRKVTIQGSYFDIPSKRDNHLESGSSYESIMIIVGTAISSFLATGGLTLLWRHRLLRRKRQKAAKRDKRKQQLNTVRSYLTTRKMEWFYIDLRGQEQGPVTELQMRAWFDNRELSPHSLVRLASNSHYTPIRNLFSQFPSTFRDKTNEDVEAC